MIYLQQEKEIPKELEEKFDDFNIYYLLKENHSPKIVKFISPLNDEEFVKFNKKCELKNEKNFVKLKELEDLIPFDLNNLQIENDENVKDLKTLQEIVDDWQNQTFEERKGFFLRKRKAMRNKYETEKKEIPKGLEEEFDEFNLNYLLHFNKSPLTNKLFSPFDELTLKYDNREKKFKSKSMTHSILQSIPQSMSNQMTQMNHQMKEEIEKLKKENENYKMNEKQHWREKEEMTNKIELIQKENNEIKNENKSMKKQIEELSKKFDEKLMKNEKNFG